MNEGAQCATTHNKSIKVPLPSNNSVLKDTISTARYSVDCIIATHDASYLSNSYTRFEGWKISLLELREIR